MLYPPEISNNSGVLAEFSPCCGPNQLEMIMSAAAQVLLTMRPPWCFSMDKLIQKSADSLSYLKIGAMLSARESQMVVPSFFANVS